MNDRQRTDVPDYHFARCADPATLNHDLVQQTVVPISLGLDSSKLRVVRVSSADHSCFGVQQGNVTVGRRGSTLIEGPTNCGTRERWD